MYKPLEAISDPVEIQCIYHFAKNKDGSMPKKLPDLTNLLEGTDDILVKAGIIADDNVSVIYSHDGSRVYFDETKEENVEVYIWSYGQ